MRTHPGEIIGLVTGPLTNLALAVRLEPELPRLLKRLVVMGGTFDYKGNTTPVSEWNIAVDPDAAKLVFDAFSGLPADAVPDHRRAQRHRAHRDAPAPPGRAGAGRRQRAGRRADLAG